MDTISFKAQKRALEKLELDVAKRRLALEDAELKMKEKEIALKNIELDHKLAQEGKHSHSFIEFCDSTFYMQQR